MPIRSLCKGRRGADEEDGTQSLEQKLREQFHRYPLFDRLCQGGKGDRRVLCGDPLYAIIDQAGLWRVVIVSTSFMEISLSPDMPMTLQRAERVAERSVVGESGDGFLGNAACELDPFFLAHFFLIIPSISPSTAF